MIALMAVINILAAANTATKPNKMKREPNPIRVFIFMSTINISM